MSVHGLVPAFRSSSFLAIARSHQILQVFRQIYRQGRNGLGRA